MEFLGTGLFVSSLLGWSFLAQKIFHRNFQASFFIGVQLLIFILYIFALFQILLIGVYLLEAIGNASLVKVLYNRRKIISFSSVIKKLFYFIPFLAFTVTIPKSFRFTMSDEFPSWAANIKTMFTENSLGGINSATRTIANGFYQSYPPFQQLFQYLYLKNTFWSESNVQIAQNILILTMLLGAVVFILQSHPFILLPAWIGAISIYFLYGFTMSNLLADGLLAIQFAACLGLAISMRYDFRDHLLLGLLIGNLILIKPTGFVLAICAIIFYISTLIGSSRQVKEKQLQAEDMPKKSTFWRKLLVLALPALTHLSWQIHLRLIQMTPGAEYFNFSKINSTETSTRWSKTWEAYKQNFFGSLYGEDNLAGISSAAPAVVRVFHISLFIIFLILAISQLSIAIIDKRNERKVTVRIAFMIIVLAILYQAFLLILYMFFFGEYEGIRSAALVRYSASFFLGWTIFVYAQFLNKLSIFRNSKIAITLIMCGLLAVAPSSLASNISGNYTDLSKLPARLDVEKMVSKTIKFIPENKRIYYLYQGSDGFEKYIFSYMVLPRKTNWTCPSLGKPQYDGDVWTCDLTLPQALRGYDYLVVGKADSEFWASNSQFLSQGSLPFSRGIFRILMSGDSLHLRLVN